MNMNFEQFSKVTPDNLSQVFDNILTFLKEYPRDKKCFSESFDKMLDKLHKEYFFNKFNKMLDELRKEDYFWVDGKYDPRGEL